METDKERWLYLFKYGVDMNLDHPPNVMETHIFSKVVDTMRTFSREERERHLYERRLLAEGQHRNMQNELQQERQQAQRERQQRLASDAALGRERQQRLAIQTAFERERQQRLASDAALGKERQQAQKERQRLLEMEAQLRQAGITPK